MKKYLLGAVLFAFSSISYAACVPFNQFNPQFVDGNGVPLSGGTMEFFTAGTTTPTNVFSDNACASSLGDTITLDSNGRPASGGSPVLLFRDTAVDYKYTLKNSAGTTIETQDDLDSGFVGTVSTNLTTAGSASAAVISYGNGTTNDPDTGFYHSADNEWSYTAGGSQRLRLPTTGLDISVSGSASTPSLFFNADTNTGLFQSASDQVGFSASGSQILEVTSAGIDIIVAGSASTPSLYFNGDTNTGLFQTAADQIGFTVGGSQILAFTTSGITGDLTLTNGLVSITDTANEVALSVSTSATTSNGVEITDSSLTGGDLLSVISNSSDTSERAVVYARNDNVAATTAMAIQAIQDASGIEVMRIDHNNNGPFIDFEGGQGASTTNSISTHGTAGALQGWIQIQINGTKRWIPFYADPSA